MSQERRLNDATDCPVPPELAAFEARLSRLTPAPPQVDRDRLMFEAGRASALAESRRGRSIGGSRFWPAAASLMTAASVFLAVLLVSERVSSPPQVEVSRVVMPAPAKVQDSPRPEVSLASATNSDTDGWLDVWPLTAWTTPSVPTNAYLAQRNALLASGMAALDRQADRDSGGTWTPPRATARELLEEYLPETARELDGPI